MDILLKQKNTIFDFTINYHNKLFLIGSCFSANIADKLNRHYFKILSNPNGIYYHPYSMMRYLTRLINKDPISSSHILERDGLFFSWLHHSSIFDTDKKKFIKNLQAQQDADTSYLMNTDYLFLTFGSAYYYQLIASDVIVDNCHKMPSANFKKILYTSDIMIADYMQLIKLLRDVNPRLKIILTISPVRYIKDGLVENNWSKAQLIHATHTLVQQFDHVYYYDAYETLIDVLRDYRYYDRDMVHPNAVAIDYIWEKMQIELFDKSTLTLINTVNQLMMRIAHRPLYTSSQSYRLFVIETKSQIEKLISDHPYLNAIEFDEYLKL